MTRSRLFLAIARCVIVSLIAVSGRPYLDTANAQQAPEIQKPEATSGLAIKIIQGENGVNIIRKKTAVKPIVEVRDKNNLPVAGVLVTFALPQSGASAVFVHGVKVLSVVTNSAGRAAVTSMSPVGTGTFNIGVSATFQGQVATATIAQTNVATAAAAASDATATTVATGVGVGGGISAVTLGIIAAAAGVAAATLVAVKRGGSSSPKGTIGVGGGGPVFGPH